MGAIRGVVEGETKLSTWLAFKRELKDIEDGVPDNVGRTTFSGGLYLIFPRRKEGSL